jgi:hypothetical protein
MRLGERIDAANAEAVRRMLAARPHWVDVLPAREVVEGMGARDVFHSGPPVTWERMSGAQRGAVQCAARFEEWRDDPSTFAFAPNHERGGVGPMAGVVSPSMPVFVVEDRASGRRAYAALEEPRMNFGAFDEAAVALRRSWRDELAPALGRAIRAMGGLDLVPLIARGLHRGDEMHNRPAAATSLMLLELVPDLLRTSERDVAIRTIEYIHADEIFFLSLSMGASKLIADAARDVKLSTIVTAMTRNGTDFGIRVSGTGDRWFTAPSPVAKGLFVSGYSAADAGADMGDSAITETAGLGGFVLEGAPAINEMLGATAADAAQAAGEMREITVAEHPVWTMPILDFRGAPFGIDIRKVVDTGILPIIDTAIAHREPGHPIIGAGLTRPPFDCFAQALRAFAEKYT